MADLKAAGMTPLMAAIDNLVLLSFKKNDRKRLPAEGERYLEKLSRYQTDTCLARRQVATTLREWLWQALASDECGNPCDADMMANRIIKGPRGSEIQGFGNLNTGVAHLWSDIDLITFIDGHLLPDRSAREHWQRLLKGMCSDGHGPVYRRLPLAMKNGGRGGNNVCQGCHSASRKEH